MPNAATSQKPTYLGLLNAISLAESAASDYLEAWAKATSSEDLASVLRLVAARERSHGEVFCRRLAELGYTLRVKTDPGAEARLAKYADPGVSDLDKIAPEGREESDPFGEIRRRLAEGEFDPMTANLMNWYIAEEKDTAVRLAGAYARVRHKGAKAARSAPRAQAAGLSADAQAIMACMNAGFARLEKSLEALARAAK